MIHAEVKPNTIGYLRAELYGDLYTKTPTSSVEIEAMKLQLSQTNELLANTLVRLNESELRFNRLCDNMTMNKVVNVKHLLVQPSQKLITG
jgi:hypothetical protein